MRNNKQDVTKKDYWVHKLKGEIKFVQTAKNTIAIEEFCEDIIQDAVEHGVDVKSDVVELRDTVNILTKETGDLATDIREANVSNSISISSLEKEVSRLKKIMLYSSVFLGSVSLITLICVLANG